MQLLVGESLDFAPTPDEAPASTSAEKIGKKYSSGDVRIVTEQARYPLATIVALMGTGDYVLNPEYQRRRRWDRERQSRLIESFIMNVPIPPVFFYEVKYSQYEVMDGLQRITAICEYYSGVYALQGLEEWPELNGLRYDELPEVVRRGIDRRYLSSVILLQETARDETEASRMKQLVFERLNSGGVKLEPQESRNALFGGPLNDLCIQLSNTPSFCEMWGIAGTGRGSLGGWYQRNGEDNEYAASSPMPGSIYERMQDVELVLRFFAFRQYHEVQQGRLRDFLDMYLRRGNNFSPEVLAGLSSVFVSTSDLIFDVLGPTAFKMPRHIGKIDRTIQRFARSTKVLYDPLMWTFSQFLDRAVDLKASQLLLIDSLQDLYLQNPAAFRGRFNHEDIRTRNHLVYECVQKHLFETC